MSTLSYLKGLVSNVHLQGEKPDVFLFSTPRSGSTFLMEVLNAQPGVKIFDEPLTVNKEEVRRELGVRTWEEFTVMPDREVRYRRFFERLRKNDLKELNRPFYWRSSRFLTNRNVFKIVHGGEDMVAWFAATFEAQIVLLVRHPIATALSHRQLPRLPFFLRQPGLRALFSPRQIALAERLIERGTILEQGVLNWTIQNAAMLRPPLDPGWALVSYEDLTLHFEESFEYLREKLQLAPIADARSLAGAPSGSTRQSDPATRAFFSNTHAGDDRGYLVEKWRARVSAEEERRAFEICDAFDLRVYEPGNLLPRAEFRIPALREGRSS
jgi:hypothetical protein